MCGKTCTLTRSGPINRSTSTVKPPLTVAVAEGFTVVSRRTPKAATDKQNFGNSSWDMLSALAQDSTPLAMEAIQMVWVHRDVMTLRPSATTSKGNTLFLYVPDGQRPVDLFAGEAVNTDNKGIRRQLHGPDAIPAFRQLQALLALQLPTPSTPPTISEFTTPLDFLLSKFGHLVLRL